MVKDWVSLEQFLLQPAKVEMMSQGNEQFLNFVY